MRLLVALMVIGFVSLASASTITSHALFFAG